MYFQLYISRMKCLFRNRTNMFWCYMFPILLATSFYFGFSNIWSSVSFETIKIAYVSAGTEDDPLLQVLQEAEMSADTPMFKIITCDKAGASKQLKDKKIDAYITAGDNPQLYVRGNGINQTIVKSFLDNYRQMTDMAQIIIEKNPQAAAQGLLEDMMQYSSFVGEKQNTKKPDLFLVYYYALFAMSCMFASYWGMDEAINIQADQSPRGARISITPVHKMKLLSANMLAAYTMHFVSMLLLLVYMKNILRINFGDNFAGIFLTCLVGSLAGLMMGAMIGVLVKKTESVKNAILTTTILAGSAFAGIYVPDLKYLVAKNVPIITYINPLNLIADALYSLYYYDTYDRFWLNIGLLGIIAAVFGAVSYMALRRKAYASI